MWDPRGTVLGRLGALDLGFSVRFLLPAIVCATALVGGGGSAVAGVVLEVELGVDDPLAPYLRGLRDGLRAAEVQVLTPAETLSAWEQVLRFDVDPRVEAALVGAAAELSTGRSLFFENRYDDSIATLLPWLDLVERDPSVLAAHPGLALALFDSLFVLIRALDANGDYDAAARVRERLAVLAWVVEPDPAEFSPSVVASWNEVREYLPSRSVAIEWMGDEDCGVYINGFAAQLANGRELHLPASRYFVQLVCEDSRSRIHVLGPRQHTLRIDLGFDDALRRDNGRPRLEPRLDTTERIHELAIQAAHLFEQDAVFTLARRDTAGRAFVEVSRVTPDGSAPPRSARVAVDSTSASSWEALARYLVEGTPDVALVVWSADRGWGDRSALGRPLDPRRVRRAAWSIGAIALIGVGAGAVFEARLAETADDLDVCADDPIGCGLTDTMSALRSEARGARGGANIAWATAGVAGAAAAVLALTGRQRSDVSGGISVTRGVGCATMVVRF